MCSSSLQQYDHSWNKGLYSESKTFFIVYNFRFQIFIKFLGHCFTLLMDMHICITEFA